jgi:malate dehydrogenase
VRLIAILGAGELGGALARQLAAARFVSRIVIIDEARTVAEGKAIDIRQASPIDGFTTEVFGSSDESMVVGADAIVLADRASASNTEWQGDLGVALMLRVAYLNSGAMIVCAGASQSEVVERGVREGSVPRHRLLGSAAEGLRSAVIAMTALEAGCSPAEVSLTVVGRPPHEIIVPWDEASIGGRRATSVLSAPSVARLDARLPRLWPPGPLTLAAAAARVLSVAAKHKRDGLTVFVAMTREEGHRGRVAMLPVTLGPYGVVQLLAPTLSTRDRVRLDTVLGR